MHSATDSLTTVNLLGHHSFSLFFSYFLSAFLQFFPLSFFSFSIFYFYSLLFSLSHCTFFFPFLISLFFPFYLVSFLSSSMLCSFFFACFLALFSLFSCIYFLSFSFFHLSLFSPCFLIFSFLSFSFLIFHFSLHYLLYFFPSIFIPLISLLFTLFVPLFLPCFSFFLWWVCLGQQPNAHPAFPPLPNRKQGEERMKNLRVEIKTWRLLTTYSKRQNRVNLMKIHLLPIKKNIWVERKAGQKILKNSFPLSLWSQDQPFSFIPHSSTFPTLSCTLSLQLLLSATSSSSPFLSAPAWMLCGQLLLQETAKCQCRVLLWLQCRYLPWCGSPQPARDPLLWCTESLLPSFFSGLGVHTTVPLSVFYPPLLPECWFCLFLNVTPEAPLSQPQGYVQPRSRSIVMNTSSFCVFIFVYFPFLSPLSSDFPIFCLCFLSLLLSSLFFSQCLLSFSPALPTFIL